ncbi:NAD-dependent epimerase/dehydratase family protein [Actinophytocola sp.]|uniref:NAD-dependent epimerase/dehydratase family protein n=1 Tax=Actinophytocola sp. TaxID=1872138 RepID=UPI002D7F0D99|nr:NAD-dependent epimerase/dehydratase family protein [Actinophytocola sp.]
MRLAIVGCGGASRKLHLPALRDHPAFRLVALVDTVREHAAAAVERYRELTGDPGADLLVTDDLAAVLPHVDAAIVASASGTHAELAATLLRAGKHTLVEKPMALDRAQAERIGTAAAVGGAVVVPGHVRRLFPLAPWIKSIVDERRIGPVLRVRWAEGGPYDWGVAGASMFAPASAGGGVLADVGPHVFDLLGHWFGAGRVVRVATNGDGGCDSEAQVRLFYGEVMAEVELSRLRQLADRIVLEGPRGSLSVEIDVDDAGYVEHDESGAVRAAGPIPVLPGAAGTWDRLFALQLAEFRRAIDGKPTALATFDDGAAVAGLLQSCRSVPAARLPRPWQDSRPRPGRPAPARVAVTGASGFIGAHVVERMAADGPVVAVVRDLRKLARLSHLDPARVRHARADIRDRAALKEIFRDCDVVVHTVVGTRGDAAELWSVTVDGTAAVLGAALDAGVRRVVHLSTVEVYDTAGRDFLDEDCPRAAVAAGSPGSYRQQKLAAENLVLSMAGGLEVVCLQPTIVYGPWGPTWTVSVLEEDLTTANETLPTGPDTGVCNALHVHDLAEAVRFAATAPGVDRQRLLVSGPDTVPWGEFYDAHRRLLGIAPPSRYDRSQVPADDQALYDSRMVVRTGRIAGLGFRPEVDVARGLAQVADWAAWAGLV